MSLYNIQRDDETVDPKTWTNKEKDQYRFGGVKYSFRGPDYPSSTVPQIRGLYAFPKGEESTPPTVPEV